MGLTRIRVWFAAISCAALLAIPAASALAASPRAGATMSVCVTAGGELVGTVSWSKMHVDGYAWFMDAPSVGAGGGGVYVPLAHNQSKGQLTKSWPATVNWNVVGNAVSLTLEFHDAAVWWHREPRPAGGWATC